MDRMEPFSIWNTLPLLPLMPLIVPLIVPLAVFIRV